MFISRKPRDAYLLIGGSAMIAVRSILQHFIEQRGHSSDATDFALGLVLGIGLGMLGLVVIRVVRGSTHAGGAT